MSSRLLSTDLNRANISQSPGKSATTKDSLLKVEYKEYNFETNPNKEIEKKVASFWKEIGDRKPPKSQFFQPQEIEDCFEGSEECTEEEENIVAKANKYKWTNTFCLFQKRGLKQAATASAPKKCPLCNNEKFAPEFADEKCLHMMKDYGETSHDD